MYVIDTSSLQQLFRCYSQERFPTLWQRFDELVAYGTITSIRQVMREIEQRIKKDGEVEWVRAHQDLFPGSTEQELHFLRTIFEVAHFRHTIPENVRNPNTSADPFLIARAKVVGATVITQEREPPKEVARKYQTSVDTLRFPAVHWKH